MSKNHLRINFDIIGHKNVGYFNMSIFERLLIEAPQLLSCTLYTIEKSSSKSPRKIPVRTQEGQSNKMIFAI
jgi:hypothetical protein